MSKLVEIITVAPDAMEVAIKFQSTMLLIALTVAVAANVGVKLSDPVKRVLGVAFIVSVTLAMSVAFYRIWV